MGRKLRLLSVSEKVRVLGIIHSLTVAMAPLYSRYVPPKKPAESVQPVSIPSNGHTDVPAITSAEPAQGKKRKRKDVEITKSDSSAVASTKKASPPEEAEEKAVKSAKKSKKTKEEKRKAHAEKEKKDATEGDVDMDDAEEDGSIPKKHTGVLSKYQKATQRQPVVDVNEATEEQGPAPILHGEKYRLSWPGNRSD